MNIAAKEPIMDNLKWGICKDGVILCPYCRVTEENRIKARINGSEPEWQVVIDYEVFDNGTACDHCGHFAQ
jgi:hypothetical protein